MRNRGVQCGERAVECGEAAFAMAGECDQVGIRNLPVSNHSSFRQVAVRNRIGPEFVTIERDHLFQKAFGLLDGRPGFRAKHEANAGAPWVMGQVANSPPLL